MDPDIEPLAKLRRSVTARKSGANAARDLHRWVHRSGSCFNVAISTIDVRVRCFRRNHNRARKVVETMVAYPVLHLSSWFSSLMSCFPKFFLGGFGLLEAARYEAMFEDFWSAYAGFQPSHPIYSSKNPEERKRCVPIALHGDEGRGAAKAPLLVLSFQVLIPSSGPTNLNQKEPHGKNNTLNSF